MRKDSSRTPDAFDQWPWFWYLQLLVVSEKLRKVIVQLVGSVFIPSLSLGLPSPLPSFHLKVVSLLSSVSNPEAAQGNIGRHDIPLTQSEAAGTSEQV